MFPRAEQMEQLLRPSPLKKPLAHVVLNVASVTQSASQHIYESSHGYNEMVLTFGALFYA